jgi:hypothetical protein
MERGRPLVGVAVRADPVARPRLPFELFGRVSHAVAVSSCGTQPQVLGPHAHAMYRHVAVASTRIFLLLRRPGR